MVFRMVSIKIHIIKGLVFVLLLNHQIIGKSKTKKKKKKFSFPLKDSIGGCVVALKGVRDSLSPVASMPFPSR